MTSDRIVCNTKTPLVSVVVITYNSSATVIETLESIKEQTYQNVELIVTDDCSKDDTVFVVQKWLESNQACFVNAELVTTTVNTGVSANLNRGIKKSSGEWIKSIAGDDRLKPYAISTYVNKVLAIGCRICLAKVEIFGDMEINYNKRYNYLNNMYKVIACYNREIQYKISLIRHILPGPALFYSKHLWEEIGGFDEKYTYSEEMAFQLKVFSICPVYLLDDILVEWRQRPDSLSNNRCSPTQWQDLDFYSNERRPRIIKEKMWLHLLDSDINYFIGKKRLKGYNYWSFLKYFSPLKYYNRIIKFFDKNHL